MAIDWTVTYVGRIDTTDPTGYPYGKIQNETAPAANDGTPSDRDWGNDWNGFFQDLLSRASITPSGTPDKVGTSDYNDALDVIYAPIAKGVTNGDTHDHNGGDGAQIDLSVQDNTTSLFTDTSHDHTGGDGAQIDLSLQDNTTSLFIKATDVTYVNLNANGDVGTGATQVSQGNHTHAGLTKNYAGVSIHKTALRQNITTAAVVTMDTNEPAAVSSSDQANNKVEVSGAGDYLVIGNVSGQNNNATAGNVGMRIRVNTVDTLFTQQEVSVSDYGDLSVSRIITLADLDDIDMEVECTGSNDFEVEDASITVIKQSA